MSSVPAGALTPGQVAVLGTGRLGGALVSRLRECGVAAVWGSRAPDPALGQVPALEAAQLGGLVVAAVPAFSWPQLPLASLRPGTVLLDPSNRTSSCPPDCLSQASSCRSQNQLTTNKRELIRAN